MRREPLPDHPPELVGATEEALELAGRSTSVSFSVAAPRGPLRRRGTSEMPNRAYLNVEGVEGEYNPGISYAVYVNLPDDADEDSDPQRYYVGNVTFFGIEKAADLDRDHPGGPAVMGCASRSTSPRSLTRCARRAAGTRIR